MSRVTANVILIVVFQPRLRANKKGGVMSSEAELMKARIAAAVADLRFRNRSDLLWEHREAPDLVRKISLLEGARPTLFVYCERGPNTGVHSYDFVPVNCTIDWERRIVTFIGTQGPGGERVHLYWHPDKTYDETGTYVSYVTVIERHFPYEGVEALKLPPLEF